MKQISCELTYIDYITAESAYEYFRGHMKSQWNLICANMLKKCRKAKTRTKLRKELQMQFFSRYVINSKLYTPDEITTSPVDEMTDRQRALLAVAGGEYNNQVVGSILLN